MDLIQATLMRAWAHLNGSAVRQRLDPPRPGRPRDTGTAVGAAAPALEKEGFAEEALPWLDAVHRFALRLTRDPNEAEDLVQETYLRAYRSWQQFERGTGCRSWLFTICRHTYLHAQESARVRREVVETDVMGAGADDGGEGFIDKVAATGSPEDFYDRIVDNDLIAAIDALSQAFREVLVMSDLGDLTYPEIAAVLGIPVGTVKSRLFRARRQVRESLLHGPTRSDYSRQSAKAGVSR